MNYEFVMLQLKDKSYHPLSLRILPSGILELGTTNLVFRLDAYDRERILSVLRSRSTSEYDAETWWNDRKDQLFFRPSSGLLIFASLGLNGVSLMAYEFLPEQIQELIQGLSDLPQKVQQRKQNHDRLMRLLSERDRIQAEIDEIRGQM